MILKKIIPQSIKNLYHYIQGVLAYRLNGQPSKDLFVIGITGTDGKTTTANILYHLLKSAGLPVALISTVGAYIGNEELDTGFHVTSPDLFPLHKLLRKIKQQGYKYVVLEATSHGLDQHRLYGTNIKMGILTNITHEHLDYHKTYQNYVKAKAKLFKSVKTAILNADDRSYTYIAPLVHPGANIITYSQKTLPKNLLSLVTDKYPQAYNQYNATAAVLAAKQLGVTDKQLKNAIPTVPQIPGRMETIPNKKGYKIIVDFAHTPNGLKNALASLKKQSTKKLIAVYGSAGLRDQQKRPLMGEIGAQFADEIILTAEDPRTESVNQIISQMAQGINTNHAHIHKIPDRLEAIKFALKIAKKGDTVGIFGKGHEKTMCFGKIEHPWSDRQAVLEILNNKE